MRLPRDPCPQLPAGPCAGVNIKGASCFTLGEPKLTALGDQPTGERPLIDRLRVIAEELDKCRDEANFGLPLPRLPVVNRLGVYRKAECRLLLGDGEHEPATADVLAK